VLVFIGTSIAKNRPHLSVYGDVLAAVFLADVLYSKGRSVGMSCRPSVCPSQMYCN